MLADVHKGGAAEVERAIDAAPRRGTTSGRAAVGGARRRLPRAAELLAGPWRETLNAATMLGQSKTAHQAEIDAACELIDFWRFNVEFMPRIYEEQPTLVAGRLEPARVPAARGLRLRGHAVQLHRDRRQPADRAGADGQHGRLEAGLDGGLSAYYLMRLFEAAGLPAGVINLVYGSGADDRRRRAASPDLAGVHFTGSTPVFQSMWKTIGAEHRRVPQLPAHRRRDRRQGLHRRAPSADAALATAIVRGTFEYQGQKCSAASRVYMPRTSGRGARPRRRGRRTIRMGDVADFRNFMGAVIDEKA